MFCKLCEKERCMKHFNHAPKQHICDDCIEMMGYDYERIGNRIFHHYMKHMNGTLTSEVQKTLPSVLEKIMVDSGLTFELKVV